MTFNRGSRHLLVALALAASGTGCEGSKLPPTAPPDTSTPKPATPPPTPPAPATPVTLTAIRFMPDTVFLWANQDATAQLIGTDSKGASVSVTDATLQTMLGYSAAIVNASGVLRVHGVRVGRSLQVANRGTLRDTLVVQVGGVHMTGGACMVVGYTVKNLISAKLVQPDLLTTAPVATSFVSRNPAVVAISAPAPGDSSNTATITSVGGGHTYVVGTTTSGFVDSAIVGVDPNHAAPFPTCNFTGNRLPSQIPGGAGIRSARAVTYP